MEAEDPLSQLADIHLPDAVSPWPPAPGWWLVAALVLLALALLGRRLLLRTLVRRRLRAALQELDSVHQAWQQASQTEAGRNQAGLDLLYGFNAILKRVALVHFPDSDVPRLAGQAWLQFLDRVDNGNEFTTGVGKALSDGTYRPVFDADGDALYALCRRWIRARFLTTRAAPKSGPLAEPQQKVQA